MYGENYGYRSGLNRSMVQHLARKAAALEALVGLSPGDVVLDIGSNDGTLLGSYTTVRSIADRHRPDRRAVRALLPRRRRDRSHVLLGESVSASGSAPARIITSIAMFYDLEDPVAFASRCRDCLAPTASGTSSSPTCRRCFARRIRHGCHDTSSTTRSRPSSESSTKPDLELIDVGSTASTAEASPSRQRTRGPRSCRAAR